MPNLEKRDIRFNSANGRSEVWAQLYTPAQVPFCVLQISHGMCEHMARYAPFARFLAGQGVAVCGNDHIGHGRTAGREEELGYFGKNGRLCALEDLKTVNTRLHSLYPGIPVVLLGHSMGSFFARSYAAKWPDTIDGLILSGTGGPNPLAGFGVVLAGMVAKIKGPRCRPALVHKLAFGTYLRRIQNPATPYDWISRDADIVAGYARDKYCAFQFTANGFGQLFAALRDVSGPRWAAAIPKNMPVMIVSGDADPVGGYGKGVQMVCTWLQGAGVKHIDCHMYPGGRHEMLNETNRAEVYGDIYTFLRRWWGLQKL